MKIIRSRRAFVGVIHKLFGNRTFNFFLHKRFLGDKSFERSWRVSVWDLSNLQVEFLKRQDGQGRRETLCTLFIIPRSPIQVFFMLLFNCMHFFTRR